MSQLRFDGRVAIVTGAGRGIGRAVALELGRRGARVLVNDIGLSLDGQTFEKERTADAVVAEIVENGGEAFASYDSVLNGHSIVHQAIQIWGRVDIVINNAGFLRDNAFHKMSESDWDLVHKTHLKGSFMVTRAAWPYMRSQKFGRIINTASVAGIFGNFGQANYSSAKLGLHGLTNTLSREGQSKEIYVNTVAPLAATRMTEGKQSLFNPDPRRYPGRAVQVHRRRESRPYVHLPCPRVQQPHRRAIRDRRRLVLQAEVPEDPRSQLRLPGHR